MEIAVLAARRGSGDRARHGPRRAAGLLLGARADALRPALWGLAVGLMARGVDRRAAASRARRGRRDGGRGGSRDRESRSCSSRAHPGGARRPRRAAAGERACGARCSCSACCSCTAFPEGLAIGTAYASEHAGLGLFVILAIALQNIPEGTSVAIPMEARRLRPRPAVLGRRRDQRAAAGRGRARLPLVEEIAGLLPFSFAFAAGAMLSLVAVELVPQTFRRGEPPAVRSAAPWPAPSMLGLAAVLGV